MKKCGQCKKQLNEQDFIKDNKEFKLCNMCRLYINKYQKQERIKFPEKVKLRDKNKRKNNLEKIRARDCVAHKKYRLDHPEEYKEKRLVYQKKNYDKKKAFDKNRMLNRPEYFLFSSARLRARDRNVEFDITEQNIKNLLDITNKCPLRGVAFERGSDGCAADNSMSLDRIDSTKGYTVDNIQIISYRANVVKNNINIEIFRKIIDGFKNFQLEIHDINNNSRKIILEDRLSQIDKDNRDKKDYQRLFNIEVPLLARAKKRAKNSKLELNIDLNYVRSIWPIDNKCPILKEKFIFGQDVINDLSATIDRIDNNKGYIKENIRIISAKANSVKNKCTMKELELILENWEKLERK